MTDTILVLLIEDQQADAALIVDLLHDAEPSIRVNHVSTLASATFSFYSAVPAVVLLDLGLPDASGLEGLVELHEQARRIPVIVLTGFDDEALAQRALQSGAQDYLVKGSFDGDLLVRTIRHAMDRHAFVERIDDMGQQLRDVNARLHQAQIALERAAADRERRIYELATLNQVSETVSSTLQLDVVLQGLVDQVRDVLRAASCGILVRERNILKCRATAGFSMEEENSHVSTRRCPALEHAMEQQTPSLWQTSADNLHLCPGADSHPWVVLVPVYTPAASIAVMTAWFDTRPVLQPGDLPLIVAMVRQAAAPIENARLYAEVERAASLMRQALMPSTEMTQAGVEVGSLYIPSSVLSGDYYSLIPSDEAHFCMVMVDVMGKGTDAAIDAIRAKTIIEAQTRAGSRPGQLLQTLNQAIFDSGVEHLLTIIYARVDPKTGHVALTAAGHEPALLLYADRPEVEQIQVKNMLIGALPSSRYEEVEINLPGGAVMLFFTDGVTEARSPEGDFFGMERLCQVAAETKTGHPQAMVDRIYREVQSFSHGRTTDDLSLLAVRLA